MVDPIDIYIYIHILSHAQVTELVEQICSVSNRLKTARNLPIRINDKR